MKRLTIRFEDSDYEAIRNEAANNKKNVSEYIRGEVSNHIEEESEHTESGMVLKGIIDAEALLGMSSDTVKRFEEFWCSDKKSKDSESMLLMFLECARKGKLFPEIISAYYTECNDLRIPTIERDFLEAVMISAENCLLKR